MILALDVLSSAAILYLVSLGLFIIFGVMKILNFAHAGFLVVGGYCALAVTQLGWHPWLAVPVAFVVGSIVGMLVDVLVMRPLYSRPMDALLAAWGLGIIFVQLITIGFGRQIQFVQAPVSGAASLFGYDYSAYRLVLIGVALLAGLLVAALLHGTRFGLKARAVIMNDMLGQALGINAGRVRFMAFSLGCGLAAVAGALLTPLSSVDPNMGFPWLVSAFMIVLLSGTSLTSMALASLVLAGAQVLVSTYVSPVMGGLTIVVLAAIILRIRPEGLARA